MNIMINKSLNTLHWILLHMFFWSSSSIIDECVRLLKRWNLKFDVAQYQMSAAYKWKTNKMQFIDWADFSEDCSEWITNWKKQILKEKLESVLW